MALEQERDEDLLARFVAGEPLAFVEFYRRHRAAILALALTPGRRGTCVNRHTERVDPGTR